MSAKRLVLSALAALGACLVASTASATIIITTVGTGNGDGAYGTVMVAGYGTPWTTPILLTDSKGNNYVVFCDDLEHDIYVAGGQMLPFNIGKVEYDGKGNLLGTMGPGPMGYTSMEVETAMMISNEMGQLADIGRADYEKGDLKGADAAQAAIWSIEYVQYGYTVSASDPTVSADLSKDLKVSYNGGGFATGLISTNGTQDQLLGVPEPSTWAMLILGVAMTGFALRRRNEAAARFAGLSRLI